MKTYETATLEDVETLCANIDRHALAAHLVLRPKEFGRLLATFHSGQSDVTLLSLPTSAAEGCKRLRLASFRDAAKAEAAGSTLSTRLAVDTSEEMVAGYRHRGGEAAEASVNLKDLRVMVAFCEACDADCGLHFETPGSPLVACPDTRRRITSYYQDGARALDWEAELVLATMAEPNLAALEPAEAAAAVAAGAAAARARLGARETPRVGSAPPAEGWAGAAGEEPAGASLRFASAADRSHAEAAPRGEEGGDGAEEEEDEGFAVGWRRGGGAQPAPPKRPRSFQDDEEGEADDAFY